MCEKPKQLDTSSAWEFCPLSCYRLLLIISGLLTYSLIYLIYAQHHALLLYFMTGFILILFKNIILSSKQVPIIRMTVIHFYSYLRVIPW